MLGAVDSLPLGVTERPDEPESQGKAAGRASRRARVSTTTAPERPLARARTFSRDRRPFAVVLYEGRHLYSLDGVRVNHFLQRARVDLLLPLRGSLGIGASGEYFFRQSFYQDEDRSQLEYRYPQFRAYLTWSLQ